MYYLFTGKEKDNSGLYYYGARYYDPELGRFISGDTVMDGLNRYTYVHNNPVKYVDPLGFTAYYYETVTYFETQYLYDAKDPNDDVFVIHEDSVRTIETSKDFENKEDAENDMWETAREKREEAGTTIESGKEDDSLIVKDTRPELSPIGGITYEVWKYGPVKERDELPDIPNDKQNQNNTNSNDDPSSDDADEEKETAGSVICTELFRQGLMEDWLYKADEDFGIYIRENQPEVMEGYHFIAQPIVFLMQKSRLFTYFINLFAKPWSHEMAYRMGVIERGNFGGKIIMFFGIPLCGTIGKLLSIAININLLILFSLIALVLLTLARKAFNKRKAILIAIAFFVINSGLTLESEQLIKKMSYRNGSIVVGEIEQYDQKGNIVKKSYIYDNNKKGKYHTYVYDNTNRLLKEEIFNSKGDLRLSFRYQYENQKKVQETLNSDGEVIRTRIDEYNHNNQVIRSLFFIENREPSSYVIYEYDDEERLVKETSYKSEDIINGYAIYEYAHDNLVRMTGFNEDGSFMNGEIYEYDTNNQLVKRVFLGEHNKPGKTLTYKYDESGRIIKINVFRSNGTLDVYIVYEYDNYAHGMDNSPSIRN